MIRHAHAAIYLSNTDDVTSAESICTIMQRSVCGRRRQPSGECEPTRYKCTSVRRCGHFLIFFSSKSTCALTRGSYFSIFNLRSHTHTCEAAQHTNMPTRLHCKAWGCFGCLAWRERALFLVRLDRSSPGVEVASAGHRDEADDVVFQLLCHAA